MKPKRERLMYMHRRAIGVLACFAFALPGVSLAAADEVAELFFNTVKPGMGNVYELGRRNHMAFHASQKDTMTWYTWEVLTGDGVGSYIIGTFGHQWKDFDGRDEFDAVDGPDAAANMGPTEAGSQQAFYLYRPDMSRPDAAAQIPSNMAAVTFYRLAPDGVNDFTNGVVKIKRAQDKTKWPGHSEWYQLTNGGEGPTFVLSQARANWAEFQAPDKTLDVLMEEAYGKKEGVATLAALRKAVRSVYSETIKYRPDLSYIPQSK